MWHMQAFGIEFDVRSGRELAIHAAVALAAITLLWRWLVSRKHQLRHIPAIGPTTPILYYWGALQWLFRGSELTIEGYKKYKGRAFRIPEFTRWVVVVSGPNLVDELRKASDNEMSSSHATTQDFELTFTAGIDFTENKYLAAAVRAVLTKNLSSLLPTMQDEVATAFMDLIPLTEEWTPILPYNAIAQIVSRTGNRLLVGLPICREPDFIDLTIQYTIDVTIGAKIIRLFPSFLKPLVARFCTKFPSSVARGIKHLGPVIEQRLQAFAEHGRDYPNKPNDILSWLIDNADDPEQSTVKSLVLRLLFLSFPAIHTSSSSFLYALYHLAAHPEYVQPLRDEVEKTIREARWSKASLDKMHKLDSFLRESQRFYTLSGVAMSRKAMKDFTFSDGTFIPKGTYIAAAVFPTHHDEEYYDEAHVFKPWRFSDMKNKENGFLQHTMVSTSVNYYPFGHGRHAWYGNAKMTANFGPH